LYKIEKFIVLINYIMSNNTNYGLGSLQKNSGSNNTAIGAYAAYNNLDSSNNTAVGSNSAFFNTTGLNNTSVGAGSMCNNTTGSLNTAVGSSALEGPTGSVGNQNTAIGAQSLYTNQGSLNTAIGTYSALGVTGGNYNTFLGANSSTLNDVNYNYSTAIGYNAKIDDSNQIMMGGTGPAGYPNIIIPGNAYLPNFTTATSETQLVPKSYVDLIGGGLKPTQACICATTADINLSLNTAIDPSSTDGFDLSTLTDGSYNILVVNQDGSSNTLTSDIDNGVYILQITGSGSTYTWNRPPSDQPMSVGKSAAGAFSFVKYGNTYARTALVQINDPAIVGTDELLYQVVYQLGVEPGQGLNSTTVGTNTYINVDSSLNFINFLDSTSGVTNATGTLSLGTKSTNTIIGPTGGNAIQIQSQIQAQRGITGATGSFTFLNSSNDTYLGNAVFSVPPTCTVSASSTNQLVNYNNFASTSGSWTPSLNASGGGSVTTYIIRSGKYIVINKLCTVQLELFVSNRGSLSGSLSINLPFTCDSQIPGSFTIGFISGLGTSIKIVDFSAQCANNTNQINLYKRTSATSTAYVALDALSDTSANAFRITINGTYLIA
jgi:hypothetical protein